MTPKSDIRAEADRLRAFFEARGAVVFEANILQPAGTLLDLYGEDIRARAFVTHDPLRGEMMLRPDFTVPLVQAHVASGGRAARYTYAGEVFRRQEEDDTRPAEYIQVGFEVFGGDRDAADAEVFTAIAEALSGLDVQAVIGDIGISYAAITGLPTSDRRIAALLRHLQQPQRFPALLDRFSKTLPPPPAFDRTIPLVGLRTEEDIRERLAVLEEESRVDPLDPTQIERLEAIMGVAAPAPEAVERLKLLDEGSGTIREAVRRLERRLAALAAAGVDVERLRFETTYLRTQLAYYGGFVFGFTGGDELPPVATGGRYDTLTAVLGEGANLPAVGGVIRADVVHALRRAG